MVYIGNIIKSYEGLEDDELIQLHYGSDSVTRIFSDDKIEKQNGDLKVSREKPKCTVIVDCNEVKYMTINKRWL